jgi:metallo-beta-lactamase class B
MKSIAFLVVAFTGASCGNGAQAANTLLNQPVLTGAAAKWNQPQEPRRIFGDTYYVGVAGLSSVLIHSAQGDILLDGDLPQSVPLIEANIRKLGFDLRNIQFILNSHAHFDHAGGISQLQRDSGATVLASPASALALRAGHVSADDPQAALTETATFPAVARVRKIPDKDTVRVGDLAITAHFTPGHTSGSTSWTWRSCEREKCLDFVYADSLSPVSAPGFHFTADRHHGDLTARFAGSIQLVAGLPCDVLITPHPDVAGIPEKLSQLAAGAEPNPFVDRDACRKLAFDAQAKLDARIAEEKAAR